LLRSATEKDCGYAMELGGRRTLCSQMKTFQWCLRDMLGAGTFPAILSSLK
jgi:hypothetical protein